MSPEQLLLFKRMYYFFLLAIALFGLLIVSIQKYPIDLERGSSYLTEPAVFFATIFFAMVLLTLSSIDTVLVPRMYRPALRTVATFFYLAYSERLICCTRSIMFDGPTHPGAYNNHNVYEAQRNGFRVGALFVLIPSFLCFVQAYLGPVLEGALENLKHQSVAGIVVLVGQLIGLGLYLVSQFVSWGILNPCLQNNRLGEMPAELHISVTTRALIFVVLLCGVLSGERESFDLGFMLILQDLWLAAPIFETDITSFFENQPEFNNMWIASTSLAFIGAIIFVGVVCAASGINAHRSGRTINAALVEGNVKWQVLYLVVAICGAVCVFVRSPYPGLDIQLTRTYKLRNFHAGCGIAVALLELVGHILSAPAMHLVAVVLS